VSFVPTRNIRILQSVKSTMSHPLVDLTTDAGAPAPAADPLSKKAKTDAEAAAESAEAARTCPVCKHWLWKACMLACGHSFCYGCAHRLARRCPSCTYKSFSQPIANWGLRALIETSVSAEDLKAAEAQCRLEFPLTAKDRFERWVRDHPGYLFEFVGDRTKSASYPWRMLLLEGADQMLEEHRTRVVPRVPIKVQGVVVCYDASPGAPESTTRTPTTAPILLLKTPERLWLSVWPLDATPEPTDTIPDTP
jgi:hypothetical protein